MATSSCLYFHVPGANTDPILIARGSGNLAYPHKLWALLLGECAPWTPSAREAVLGLAGPALQTGAAGAIARFAAFSAFVQSHPMIGRIPELPVFLDGVLSFLRERLAPFGDAEAQLIAQADGEPDDPLPVIAARFQQRWAVLAGLIERRDHHMLDAFLELEYKGYDFTYGRTWAQADGFGIHTLAHPYFRTLGQLYANGCEHAPQAPAYDGAPYSELVPRVTDASIQQAKRVAAYRAPWPYEEWSEYAGDGHFVRQGARWGFHTRERLVLPCEFDRYELLNPRDHSLKNKGARVWQNGSAGWVRPDGKLVVPAKWDNVEPTYATGLFSVQRDGRWGLVDRSKRQILPCEFEAPLVPLAFGCDLPQPEFSPSSATALPVYFSDVDISTVLKKAGATGQQLIVEARKEGGTGVIDQAGGVVVPFAYAAVEVACFGTHRDVRWFKVTSSAGLHGVWSAERQCEVIPCTHEWLAIVVHPEMPEPLLITGDAQRYRLWNSDGSAWSQHELLWVSDNFTQLQAPWPGYENGLGVNNFTLAWIEGRPQRALVATYAHPQGRLMRFSRTEALHIEPMSPPRETLEERWLTRGDRAAAKLLSESASAGFYEPKDDALARLWAARACGEEGPPATASEMSDAVVPGAASSYFRMLDRGIGGPRDAARARYWAGQAAPEFNHYYGKREYVRLLLDESAGSVEAERALEIIRGFPVGTREGNTFAVFHARLLIEGWVLAQDWPAARELLYVSHRCNDREGAPVMADLLRRWAATLDPSEAQAMLVEAAYHQARTDHWPNRLVA